MTGNGKHTTYKHGDDWGMVLWHCLTHIYIYIYYIYIFIYISTNGHINLDINTYGYEYYRIIHNDIPIQI